MVHLFDLVERRTSQYAVLLSSHHSSRPTLVLRDVSCLFAQAPHSSSIRDMVSPRPMGTSSHFPASPVISFYFHGASSSLRSDFFPSSLSVADTRDSQGQPPNFLHLSLSRQLSKTNSHPSSSLFIFSTTPFQYKSASLFRRSEERHAFLAKPRSRSSHLV